MRVRQRVPPILLGLMTAHRDCFHAEAQAGIDLMLLTSRLSSLLCAGREELPVDLIATLRSCLALDVDLVGWTLTLPRRYNFWRRSRPVDLEAATSCAFNDVYENHLAAAVWNRYRYVRILTNEQIVHYARQVTPAGHAAHDQIAHMSQQATVCIRKLSEDICYSVESCLDYSSSSDQDTDISDGRFSMYWGSATLEPLLLAANEERVGPAMFLWIIAQVKRIAKDTGIVRARQIFQHAAHCATLDRSGNTRNAWLEGDEAICPMLST